MSTSVTKEQKVQKIGTMITLLSVGGFDLADFTTKKKHKIKTTMKVGP